jgi:AcrR family transcriptional regulator
MAKAKQKTRQPRDAEASKRRILSAAAGEFTEFGIAGARMDRIAAIARCNKNLVYIYFKSKEKLFIAVLDSKLKEGYGVVEFTPDDLPGYAGRMFDYAVEHPDLFRLVTWLSLEQRATSPASRGNQQHSKLAAIAEAQQAGRVNAEFTPGFLLTAIAVLATAYTPSNSFGPSIDPAASGDLTELRRMVVSAVESMCRVPVKKRH